MMLDWTNYLRQLLDSISRLGKTSPDTVRGYQTLVAAGRHSGVLDAKTRELIALGCAVTARCDGCITVHANAAVSQGATREEVAEAVGVAVALGAGAALVYAMRTLEAFEIHSATKPGAPPPVSP
jgi:AhpD family alkylhydroperoxidase